MSPPNLNFWSISRKESPESQQKHALRNRFLRTLLCSKDVFIPGYNRKTLIRKRTSILVWICFNYEQLFQPRQCTACRKCQCSSRGKRAWPAVFCIQSFLNPFQYPWDTSCFHSGTRQCSPCLYQFESWCILFSYHCKLSILNKKFHLLNHPLQYLAIAEFLPELAYFFPENLYLYVQLDTVPVFFSFRKRFFSSPLFQLIVTRLKRIND